ncbi:ABC transporter permease subunit [Kribbella shirazensis]|uniref:ABC-2 type transport system permease protein n=1 Tax=Kribbella shirazensis TaxID=1105143 RepID=A0A7X5V5Q5_9ACTN|nr:ABC transporter permease subunit [Kribbella shirazensis]NIK54398.1 ABC-2 type transport system permease protein [Kribbella shirazensis]
MIRLTKVELRRLTARRLTAIGVAGLFLITALLLVATWFEARPLSAAEQQQAQRQYEMMHQDWVEHADEQRKQCAADWQTQPDPKPKLEEMCAYPEPKPEDFGKPKIVFAEVTPELLQGSSYFLAFAAFLIGASFIGAEFSTGAIGNWLTFEPRRLRVYGSKLLAAATGFVPVAAVVLAIVLFGTFVIVDRLGDTASATAKVWGDLAAIGGRAVVTTALAAVLGSIVGLLLRHTAAAIGVVMAYLVLAEGVFGSFLQDAQPWLVKLNFDAFVRHDTQYYVEQCKTSADGSYMCDYVQKTLSFEHGAWYLAVLTVAVILIGGWVFRRRDIN